jgi:hypothetical protein
MVAGKMNSGRKEIVAWDILEEAKAAQLDLVKKHKENVIFAYFSSKSKTLTSKTMLYNL